MTNKEKLQELFDAALREPTPATGGPPKRAVPESKTSITAPIEKSPLLKPAPEVSLEVSLPGPTPEPMSVTLAAPALDREAAEQLGSLLDEKIRKTIRKRRRSALITALVLFGSLGGGAAWFVQSPERIEAFASAIREVRSVGDVKSIVAKFQKALDRVEARSQQIDQATAALGVTPSAEDEIDPNMNAEMKEMMGGEGRTVGERNGALQASFGDRAKEAGGVIESGVALSKEDSFDFN
jgi:hypothetical protein